jgi:ATP synthase protein I
MARNSAGERKAEELARCVERKGRRHERRAGNKDRVNPWLGLSMFGMIGWSVSIPTLLGLAVGVWLDKRHGGGISWTLTLLFAGVAVGAAIAWHWLRREGGRIGEDGPETEDEERD